MSDSSKRKIVVIGGTGQQGSAVINALLSANQSSLSSAFHLVIPTRDPQSKKALALKERYSNNVELVQTDLDQVTVDQLASLLQGASGVFCAQELSKREVEQGQKIIDAAVKANVEHFVYSSVGHAHAASSVPHFHTKFLNEEYLKGKSSLQHYTILRPWAFMENLFWMYRNGKLFQWFNQDKVIQHTACEDIGKFAAEAFMNREKFGGQTIELASEPLNGYQLQETFSRVFHRPVEWVLTKPDTEDWQSMADFIKDVKFRVDVEKLKKDYGIEKTKSVEEFLREHKNRFQ